MLSERVRWLGEASKRRRYLVGVSGGADSVALLHLLVGAGFPDLVVCHLDHGLRGVRSTADARWVGGLAERLGLACETGRSEVAARSRSEGISVETAGRRARHEFFAACGRKWRCSRVLLAHHADDQAETVLWNLLRGSRGASGMASVQEMQMAGRRMTLIRPLLGVRRGELRAWLEGGGLAWREDASNAEPVAVRNRLRNEALPLLEKIAGRDVTVALAKAAASDAELREIEAWAVARAGAMDPQGRLHVPALRGLPAALAGACVRQFLTDSGVPEVGRELVGRVLGVLESGAGPAVNLPGGKVLRRRRGRLVIGD